MKTKHRKASAAKRRWQADPSSIFRLMSRIQPFTNEELVKLETPVKLAFERVKVGTATRDDLHTLAAALNVALVRSEEIDPLCEQTCVAAQEGMIRTIERHNATGRMGFDGMALQDIPPALDLYEQILGLSTPMQMQAAMRETLARMNRGLTL